MQATPAVPSSSPDKNGTTRILKNLLLAVLEQRPGDPIVFMRDHLKSTIKFQSKLPIIQAYHHAKTHSWYTIEFWEHLALAYNALKSNKSDRGIDIASFAEYLRMFLMDFEGIQTRLLKLCLSWMEHETIASFEIFAMASLTFCIFEDFMNHVVVLFKFKAHGGQLPYNILHDAFVHTSRLNEDIIGDPREGVRLHLAKNLFDLEISSEQKPLKFVSMKDFEMGLEKGLGLMRDVI
ncbi:hypothetical protein BC830DRAFT_1091086 [Chytriomyces sp. MP71]|nr:hypothetical protein BC830DRAFT_1091086 [Chytriomyces sp. MP71]